MKNWKRLFVFTLMTGCAAVSRDCSSCMAGAAGADWLVVQFKMDGDPINCWQLRDVSMSNEERSDGIYWKSSDGHLVHLSGWYNRVQVSGGAWAGAANALGIELGRCVGGKYVTHGPETTK